MPLPRNGAPRLAAIGTALAAMLLSGALALLFGPALDARLLDAQFAFNRQFFPQPVARDVVVVGIDEAFLDGVDEPLALSHRYLAEFLRSVGAAKPTVIGLDIVLPEKRFDKLRSVSDPQFDFHRTLLAGLIGAMRDTKLVLAKVWDHQRGHFRDIQLDYASVLSMQEGAVQASASALVLPDPDGRVRRYAGPELQPGNTASTLSSEISAAFGSRQNWSGLINYQLGDAFSYIPLQDVLRLAREGNSARLRQLFAGKPVLLGTVQEDMDLLPVPVPLASWRPGEHRVPGVLVHAQSVRSMLNNGFIAPAPALLSACLTAVFALCWLHPSVWRKALLLLAVSAGLVAASTLLLRYEYWLPVAGLLLAGWSAMLLRSALEFWRTFHATEQLRRRFSGSVSPAVMKEILAGRLDADAAGGKLPVCVLFSDIRDFTAISERLDGDAVVTLLNRYFARMAPLVHKHGGTVDKFIGDGMMALFGAPQRQGCPEQAALEAAHDMLAELAGLNAELERDGLPTLRIGIGIHTGMAAIGYIGSPERHAYTAVGDTVNIAARLESMCKPTGYLIVCSEAVADALGRPEALTALGQHALKGRQALVSLYGWNPVLALDNT